MLETVLPPVFGKELKSVAFFDGTFLSEGAFFWRRSFSTFFSPVSPHGKTIQLEVQEGRPYQVHKTLYPPG